MSDDKRVMDLGDDPLDPHGDGTIRKGDPMYDLLMSGTVMGNRREDGLWEVQVQEDEPTPIFVPTPSSRRSDVRKTDTHSWWLLVTPLALLALIVIVTVIVLL